MAEKKYQQKKIQDTEGGGFGSYTEDTGGGKPFAAGDSNTRTTKENGKYRKANNKTMQPRTDDGKFTYKSVNGQSIDPQYGPSRGKTVNPLLTGGKNGVKIDDVEEQFASQSGAYWDKYKDKWYRKGGQAVVNGLKVKVSAKAIWDVAKSRYDELKGEFEGESKVFDKSKMGKTSEDAKAAKQKAKATGESQYVIEQQSGGIKGGQKELQEYLDSMPKKEQKPFVKKEVPVSAKPAEAEVKEEAEIKEAPVSAKSGVKYGPEQIDKVKQFFKTKFSDQPEKVNKLLAGLDAMSPEKLDAQIDSWISKGTDFGL